MLSRRLDFMNKSIISRLYNSEEKMKSAKLIRKEFLNYFLRDHSFVRSSPVLNLNDPSSPFVNAGMNQFKGIFLGRYDPPVLRATNSQKCIRVGGKHNDLDEVGLDTYHHTFFEMLGNWSFGDYSKEEACKYAWNLLTEVYGINKDLLYVSYFCGDEKLGLGPDLECKDIWLRLGVPPEKILAFGTKDNFWEMASAGPCGLCTEIHISEKIDEPVNLMELWNLVFIQNERLENGQIISLPKHHVDTGMGFERLVAILQGKKSNYDTDLFVPLFESIEKYTKAPRYKGNFGISDTESLDTGYRILADHARMVTVALADGALPDQNQKLRRVLRKALDISEKTFRKGDLVHELTYTVAEILGETYPELQDNLKQVQYIIKYEEELLKSLKKSSGKSWEKMVKQRPALSTITDYLSPGLISGYNDLQAFLKSNDNVDALSGEFAFRLYDTHGLNANTIAELAEVESLKFDTKAFDENLEKAKKRSKARTEGKMNKESISELFLDKLEKLQVPKTDDSLKYNYFSPEKGYFFPPIKSRLLGFIINGNLKLSPEIDECPLEEEELMRSEVNILLDKTPFYVNEGGQTFDKGYIQIKSLLFDIYEVRKIRGFVFHVGHIINNNSRKIPLKQSDLNLKNGDVSQVWINSRRRLGAMRNHTATHLLNAALRKILPTIGQRGSYVERDKLSFECSLFGQKLTNEKLEELETLINNCIEYDGAVKNKIVNKAQMMAEDNLTIIPGEVYPEIGIRIVNVDSSVLKSKEVCCGTHVHRTGSLDHFCILYVNSKGKISVTIQAATGPLMRLAKLAGKKLKNKILNLEDQFQTERAELDVLDAEIHDMQRNLMEKGDKILLSYIDYRECQTKLSNLSKAITLKRRSNIRNDFETEITKIRNMTTLPFVVLNLELCDAAFDELPLKKLEKMCSDIPILVLAISKYSVKSRCFVPKEMSSSKFNAKIWMEPIIKMFQAKGFNPSNQSDLLCYGMKEVKISRDQSELVIHKALNEAKSIAHLNLKVPATKEMNKSQS